MITMPDRTNVFRDIVSELANRTGQSLSSFAGISNLPQKKEAFHRAAAAVYAAIRSCAKFLRDNKRNLGTISQATQYGKLEGQVGAMLKKCGEQVDMLQRNFISMKSALVALMNNSS